MLTVTELARMLRLSKPTLYAAIKRGDVPGVVQVGRVLRVAHREKGLVGNVTR